jgi:hypothetical protein
MKTWIGRLHGAQLVMLLMALTFAGTAVSFIGFYGFLVPSNLLAHQYSAGSPLHSVQKDTMMAAVMMRVARSNRNWGFGLIGTALLAWATAVAALWIWFGARRGPAAPERE